MIIGARAPICGMQGGALLQNCRPCATLAPRMPRRTGLREELTCCYNPQALLNGLFP